ncbi:GDSL-type esterase/lipase family protein [Oryzobacter terrae]|uniref:GDSL-type esterase/lipase family protein n=1 Tax=Oryzobacter terrae TaxID=1620385 RepID=UPI00366FC599
MTDDPTGEGTPSLEFRPSAQAHVSPEGPRDVAVVFLGASLVAGVGDPKGQGWVTRVVGRTSHPDLTLTAYNLGVRGNTSADVLRQWAEEVPARWVGRTERRVVVSVGSNDVVGGISLARHRLNLANLLDEAAAGGVHAFVVSPPPTDDAELNSRLEVLVEAQADVCARRSVPFVDCYTPLSGHDQWRTDLAASSVPHHPGQAGYGLIAWLVLHHGWTDWLQIG